MATATTGRIATPFERAQAYVQPLGVVVDNELIAMCSQWLGRGSLDELRGTKPEPSAVARAWLECLGASVPIPDTARVFALALLRELLGEESDDSTIDAGFAALVRPGMRPLKRVGSWFEASRRLNAALYHLGRKGAPSEQKQRALAESRALGRFLITHDWIGQRKPQLRMAYHGYAGVAALLLARTDSEPLALYEAAVADLEISGAEGDRSIQHVQYLAEAYLHVYEINGDEDALSGAERHLQRVSSHAGAGRRFDALVASAALQRGIRQRIESAWVHAAASFARAIDAVDHAFLTAPDETISESYLRQLRGQARYQTHAVARSLDPLVSCEMLDLAIADLRSAGPDGICAGQGGSSLPKALLQRSGLARDAGNLVVARDLLLEARPLAALCPDATLEPLIENALASLAIETAVRADDLAAVHATCETMLVLGEYRRVPFASLAHGARLLARSDRPLEEIAGVIEGTVKLAESYLAAGELEPGQIRFIASHAGSLARVLADHEVGVRPARRAYALFRAALDAVPDETVLELIGAAGDAALRLAKHLVAEGADTEAVGFFEDAILMLSRAITSFEGSAMDSLTHRADVSYSKLGEAALRINAINRDERALETAIAALERSRELGNDSPELQGLLGDVYFRRGRRTGDLADLQRCVALKAAARARGNASRENFSVSARVHLQLEAMTPGLGHARTAVELLGGAMVIDPSWPWPLFQLAEFMASETAASRAGILAELAPQTFSAELEAAFRDGEDGPFLDEAARRVLRNKEFRRSNLGGRRGRWDEVYVLDDPHRLLSASFVFKQTTRDRAEHDRTTNSALRRFLREHGAPPAFGLPSPMHVFPVDDAPVHDAVMYLMRKIRGVELGHLAIAWRLGRGADPRETYFAALDFLAYFHAWAQGANEPRAARLADVREAVGDAVPKDVVGTLRALPSVPLLAKKDAHPENWLVGPSREIVMLDFESTKRLPLGVDVAQLLEDYPLFSNDDAGWVERMDALSRYRTRLEALGVRVAADAEALAVWYATFALWRCRLGTRRLGDRSTQAAGTFSSSELRSNALRTEHYRELLRYLAASGPTSEIRAAARDTNAAPLS